MLSDHQYFPTRIEFIIKFLPLVEPYFCKPCIVVVDNASCSARKRVGSSFAKDMTHMTTRGYFYRPSTHPHLDTQLIIKNHYWLVRNTQISNKSRQRLQIDTNNHTARYTTFFEKFRLLDDNFIG